MYFRYIALPRQIPLKMKKYLPINLKCQLVVYFSENAKEPPIKKKRIVEIPNVSKGCILNELYQPHIHSGINPNHSRSFIQSIISEFNNISNLISIFYREHYPPNVWIYHTPIPPKHMSVSICECRSNCLEGKCL